MMKLSLLLFMALPALSSARLGRCENNTRAALILDQRLKDRVPQITNGSHNEALPTPPEIQAKNDQSSPFILDQTNLKWETFDGTLPNGAVSIYNGYVGRTHYVCQFWWNAGFFNPDIDTHCHYSYGGSAYYGAPFQILVNKDNFEFLEWKEDSDGSVPHNSVETCLNCRKFVGKNEYGLGRVDAIDNVFYLPWGMKEYWYSTYQVLTFSKDVYSEHMSDIKYKLDGVNIIENPPETMERSTISNHDCQPVTGTATLTKTTTVEQRWDTSFSITAGAKTTITAGIPLIGSTDIEISVETTLQFSKGTTYTESKSYSVSVQHNVPPNHSCSVSMVAYKYGADIPYTARLSRTYRNGDTTWTSISGTYKSVQIGEVRAVVDRCLPVPDPTPCN